MDGRRSVVMMAAVALVALVVAGAAKAQLTDEQYYAMPRLFHLDDYDMCLAMSGTYCLGSFTLGDGGHGASPLLLALQKFSRDVHHFNHTRLHRGYCVTSKCVHIDEPNIERRFAKCVDYYARKYGLQATLEKLEYCKTATPPRPIDAAELSVACIIALIVAVNILATLYDLVRNKDEKPNKYLIVWSLRSNWQRLTATYDNGDPKLAALNPVHGIRAVTLIFVMLAHSVLVYHMAYVFNPKFLEDASAHPLSMLFQNGSLIVQTFFLLSSFLFAFNLLVYRDSGKQVGLRMLPHCLLHRAIRIVPVHVCVVSLVATWWRRAAAGAQWGALLGAEAERCRDKWWTHALFLNNLIKPEVRCLIQTWFLAVDMQVYVVAVVVTLALASSPRSPRLVLGTLAALLAAAVGGNFLIALHYHYKPIVALMNPELMRQQYSGQPSFEWMYAAPWNSLPASLLGLALAFVYRELQQTDFKPTDYKYYMWFYRCKFWALVSWVMLGLLVQHSQSPVLLAGYAALDRPGFALIAALGLIGVFYNVDSYMVRVFRWGGWRAVGRMSLSVLMCHWPYCLAQLAARGQPAAASVYEIGGHWFVTIFMSYVTALPLYLFLEAPAQRFLQTLVI